MEPAVDLLTQPSMENFKRSGVDNNNVNKCSAVVWRILPTSQRQLVVASSQRGVVNYFDFDGRFFHVSQDIDVVSARGVPEPETSFPLVFPLSFSSYNE